MTVEQIIALVAAIAGILSTLGGSDNRNIYSSPSGSTRVET